MLPSGALTRATIIRAFTTRPRGDVDIHSIRADLVSVLHDTVLPAHASVWLRGMQR